MLCNTKFVGLKQLYEQAKSLLVTLLHRLAVESVERVLLLLESKEVAVLPLRAI